MNDEAFHLIHRSVIEHAMTDDERLLERLRITREKELPEVEFLFRIFGKPCFPRGELVLCRCPGIVDHLSLNAISSFLSITPQMLSIIRKGITFDGKNE